MKSYHKLTTGVLALIIAAMTFTACTDEIKFGNAFIEKTPGGTVSLDGAHLTGTPSMMP